MKKMLSIIPTAVSVAFLAVAFTPAQAGPMGLATSHANVVSETGLKATTIKRRGSRRHRSFRHRGNRHYRKSRRRHFRV